jgi:hypothetical protein
MSLIIKKNTIFKIPRTGSGAPTTLPLSTPSLYLSGLSFADNDPNYRFPFFSNPYNKYNDPFTFWGGFTAGILIYNGIGWEFSIGCDYNDGDNGWVYGYALVAYKISDGMSIPTSGYTLVSNIFITSGTLVISATP